MDGIFEYWYLMPIAVAIATIAMASGIGGAVFFSPLFLIVLRLEPSVAIGAALITEFFGFSSGLIAYYRAKLIDFKLGINLIVFAVPAAIVGSLIAGYFDPEILKTIFAVGIIFIGWQLFSAYREEEKEKLDNSIRDDAEISYESALVDKAGNTYQYTVCNKSTGRFFALVGGMFVGMISVGLAELQEYHLVGRCRVPAKVAVATSIFAVVITVFFASIGHIASFIGESDAQNMNQVIRVVLFTIPGVIIGGQVGPYVQEKVAPSLIKISIAVLFTLIGFLMLVMTIV
jgi:uncharacterized membrane protein YfcA